MHHQPPRARRRPLQRRDLRDEPPAVPPLDAAHRERRGLGPGDGKPDLAVPTGNGLVILLGTGNANAPYKTGTTIPLSGPGCPIAGDLNGNGKIDILVMFKPLWTPTRNLAT